jgi:hypothetical protein
MGPGGIGKRDREVESAGVEERVPDARRAVFGYPFFYFPFIS